MTFQSYNDIIKMQFFKRRMWIYIKGKRNKKSPFSPFRDRTERFYIVLDQFCYSIEQILGKRASLPKLFGDLITILGVS